GATSCKKPWSSASYPMVTRVPPSTRSNPLRNVSGRGPDTVFHAVIRFGSDSVISYIASIRLPRNSPTKQDVAPTPRGPSDVFLASTHSRRHFASFSRLARNAKTSSRGLLITKLDSNPRIQLISFRSPTPFPGRPGPCADHAAATVAV